MGNKKQTNEVNISKIYLITYSILIIFAVYNMILCRIDYGFFGFNSEFIASFFNSIFIIIAIIFLKTRDMKKKLNISFFRIIGIIIVIAYPIIVTASQMFSLFEFKEIAFNVNDLRALQDTYLFLNIPVSVLILIVANKFKEVTK